MKNHGRQLFEALVDYLEYNNFYSSDRHSPSFGSGNQDGWARISLGWDTDRVSLIVRKVASSNESLRLEFCDYEQARQVLDVLMFVIRTGESGS